MFLPRRLSLFCSRYTLETKVGVLLGRWLPFNAIGTQGYRRPFFHLARLALLTICLILSFSPTVAQRSWPTGVRAEITPALVNAEVRYATCMAQDSRGFIWVGTSGGLFRYDGENLLPFCTTGGLLGQIGQNDRPDLTPARLFEQITSLAWDGQGFLWVGLDDGLLRFEPRTQQAQWFQHLEESPLSLSDGRTSCILIDRSGSAWVGTRSGLNRLDRITGRWTRYYIGRSDTSSLFSNRIHAMLEDDEGTLWLSGGRHGSLFCLKKQESHLRQVGHLKLVQALCLDSAGHLWAACDSMGLCKIDRRYGTITRVPIPEGVFRNRHVTIRSLCADKAGGLWVGTWEDGLLRYDLACGTFTRYSLVGGEEGSVDGQKRIGLFLDRDGLLWVSSSSGLFTAWSGHFSHQHRIDKSPRVMGHVSGLCRDGKGGVLVREWGEGLWRYDPVSCQTQKLRPETQLMGSMYGESNGNVWISEGRDLLKYTPWTGKVFLAWRAPLWHGRPDTLDHIFVDREHSLWLSSGASLFHVSKDLGHYARYRHDPENPQTISSGQIGEVVEDRNGDIWIGTSNGLNRFDRRSGGFQLIGTEANPGGEPIYGLHVDHSGNLWVSSAFGIYRKSDHSSSFDKVLPEDDRELFGRIEEGVVEDHRGYLWFASGPWICRIDPVSAMMTSFHQQLSVGRSRFHVKPMTLENGELLFGMGSEFVVFNPDSVAAHHYPPAMAITGIWKQGERDKKVMLSDTTAEIVLGPGSSSFSISFANLSYEHPEHHRYKYFLQGFDHAWTNCFNKREATYTNIGPGRYRFSVIGADSYGSWNKRGATLNVIVRPQYWQTWWFRLLIGTASVGLLATIVWLLVSVSRQEVTRLKREKQLQHEFSRLLIEAEETGRKRLASELHDGLGQNLLLVSNELEQYLYPKSEPSGVLARTVLLVHESIETLRDIAANLHPHQLDRLGLCAAVETMVESVARSSGVIIQCTCESNTEKIARESQIHIFRIIQEALSNVVRHAQATKASVSLWETPTTIELTIVDNGTGFVADGIVGGDGLSKERMPASGLGLSSMAERARIIGAALRVMSSPGAGTTIQMALPIRTDDTPQPVGAGSENPLRMRWVAASVKTIFGVLLDWKTVVVLLVGLALLCLRPGHWKPSGLSNVWVRDIAATGSTFFAATASGVYRSTDEGTDWMAASNGIPNRDIRTVVCVGSKIFAATWGNGVFLSLSNGEKWDSVNTGLENRYVYDLTSSSSSLFAGTWGGVFVSTNGGTSWSSVREGLVDNRVLSVAVGSEDSTMTMLLAGTVTGVYRSTNGGVVWTAANDGLGGMYARSFAWLPGESDKGGLFATTTAGVFRSTDGGADWHMMNNGLPSTDARTLVVNQSDLFVGVWEKGIFASTNGGATWSPSNDGVTDSVSTYHLVVIGSEMFAATKEGIFRRSL
jgi:signal transduction histidine kinase/ligand-binding sensor domain-containing protein